MEKEKEEIQQHCLCDYGCGREAKHILKNGKHCCEKSHSKCPAVKEKLSNSIKKNIQRWKEKGQSTRHHDLDPSKKYRNKHRIDNHGKCDNPGCTNYNDGSYGSGRFCSEHCAYAYAVNTTKDSKKRKAHYDKLHKTLKETKWKTNSWKCRFCGQIFDTRKNLKEHVYKDHYGIDVDTSKGLKKCPFCDKEFDKPSSVGGHIINCKKNPNKNFYDDAHKRAGETCSKNYFNNYTKNGTIRIQARNSRYSIFKNINGEEYLLQSSFELKVAQRLNEDGIYWENNTRLTYVINGKTKAYRPDMTIPSLNCYIEVKGWFSEKDQKKMKAVLESNPNIKMYFIYGKDYDDFIARKIDLNDNMIMTKDNIYEWISKK